MCTQSPNIQKFPPALEIISIISHGSRSKQASNVVISTTNALWTTSSSLFTFLTGFPTTAPPLMIYGFSKRWKNRTSVLQFFNNFCSHYLWLLLVDFISKNELSIYFPLVIWEHMANSIATSWNIHSHWRRWKEKFYDLKFNHISSPIIFLYY